MRALRCLIVMLMLMLVVSPALAVDGYGTLSTIGAGEDAVTVLYTGGAPYEIGYWHGSLLRTQVQQNVQTALTVARLRYGQATLQAAWQAMVPFIRPEFLEELQGLADGSGVAFSDLQELHAMPDVSEFHCSAFNACGPATAAGQMIQMRNLDYDMDLGMQDHPLIIVSQPRGGGGSGVWANVSFAGFIGCIVGMNAAGIGVSEMGDSFDYAHETLAGVPMPCLLRDVLAHTSSFFDAYTMIETASRTSSYWYVVGDAESAQAALFRTSPTIFQSWSLGSEPAPAPALPSVVYGGVYNDRLYGDLLTNWGNLTPETAIAISRHNAMTSNLLDAIYDLTNRDLWVSYAQGLLPASGREFSHLNIAQPPARFTDDFEDPSYTTDNWWLLTPGCRCVTVDSNGVLEARGANDPANTRSETNASPAQGRGFFVDGLHLGADVRVLAGAGGLAWGNQGAKHPTGDPTGITYGCYYLAISPADDLVGIAEMTPDGEATLAAVSVPGLEFGAWYRMELVSTFDTFQVWMAPTGQPLGKVLEVAQDVLHPGWQVHQAGPVTVFAENRPASLLQFDNVLVEGAHDYRHWVSCPFVRALREEPATVGVWLGEGAGVVGFQFDIVLDPSVDQHLTLLDVAKGALISDPNWTLSWTLVGAGHGRVLAYHTGSQPLPQGAHGEMVRFTFVMDQASPPRLMGMVHLQDVVLSDQDAQAMPVAAADGLVRVARVAERLELDAIASPQCASTPISLSMRAKDEYDLLATLYQGTAQLAEVTGTISPTTATFSGGLYSGSVTIGQGSASDQITATDLADAVVTGASNSFQVLAKGDPTGDGVINVLDVVRTVNIALGTMQVSAIERAAADANSDGLVNVLDVVRIQNMALGIQGAAAKGASALRAAPVVVSAPAVTATKRIAVPVVINRAQGVAGFNFDLSYDPVLTPVEVRAGALLAGQAGWLVNANLARRPLRVLCYHNQARPLTGGKGTLVEVIFTQNGRWGRNSLALSGAVFSDQAGSALSRTLSLGHTYSVK